MVTVEAPASAQELPDSVEFPPHLLDVCLRIPLSSPIGDEELERFNSRNPGWKIELGADNTLEARRIAGGDSSDITLELGRQLGNWRVGGAGGRVRESDGTYKLDNDDLGEHIRSPDVSWISPELLTSTQRAMRPKRGFWRLCPTFVIEVRSPSDTLAAQQRRMAEWLQFGVELGWLVDSIERTVWIYRPNEEPEQLNRPDELSGESVLEGLTVDMSEVWALASEDAGIEGSNA